MAKKFFVFAIFLFLSIGPQAWSEVKIQFPDEELASESVLPVFEERVAVKNRKVEHSKRFEFNFMGGMVVSEPLYSPYNFGVSLTYHFDNSHAVHLMGTYFLDDLSQSGQDLRDGKIYQSSGQTGANKFDPSEAPHKQMFFGAHYQYTAYYGKISITADSVMNLTLAGLFGGGAYTMDGTIAPAVNIGLSQRLYFNSVVALRFDLLFSAFSGPDITSAGSLRPDDNYQPKASDFENALQFDSNIYVGLSFLL